MKNKKLKKALKQIKKALEYRLPKEIGCSSSSCCVKCPTCGTTALRDFQAYCSSCGQCLSWDTHTDVLD